MKEWVTREVVGLLSDPAWTVEIQEPGGDIDTENLILEAVGAEPGQRLHVSGFRTDNFRILDPSRVEIEMVEVSDGQDSSGGLSSSDLPTALMFGHVTVRLRHAGFVVVPSYKPYF